MPYGPSRRREQMGNGGAGVGRLLCNCRRPQWQGGLRRAQLALAIREVGSYSGSLYRSVRGRTPAAHNAPIEMKEKISTEPKRLTNRPTAQRSAIMAKVASRNSGPELAVRRLLHSLGYRFRLHRKDLPGTPDIVFPGRRKVIWVHGCFWHHHPQCRYASVPLTNRDYWLAKFRSNVARDQRDQERLARAGWAGFVVWQCQLKQPAALAGALASFLGPPKSAKACARHICENRS